MDKNIIIISLFVSIFVSGCFFGDVGSGYITKTCSRIITYDQVKVIEEKVIKSKDNDIVQITFNNTINTDETNNTFKSIKNSYISEFNDLTNSGLKTEKNEEIKNQLKVSYEFDISTISDTLKEKYDFEQLAHNQIKKYEKEGYECK